MGTQSSVTNTGRCKNKKLDEHDEPISLDDVLTMMSLLVGWMEASSSE